MSDLIKIEEDAVEEKSKTIADKIAGLFVMVISACAASIMVALTIKFIMWLLF